MTRLAGRGHRVLYVDPSWSYEDDGIVHRLGATAPSLTGIGLRRVDERLHVFRYRYARLLRWRFNRWRWPLTIRAMTDRLGFEPERTVAVTIHPRWWPVLQRIRPRASVYYAVDEMTGFPNPEERKREIRRWEEALLRDADLALAVSDRLTRRFRTVQPLSYYLPNAADVDHFAPERLRAAPPHPDLADLPAPRIGFVGQVDERLDQELLGELAANRPDWQVVLTGRVKDGVDVSRLEAVPNIHLLGYVDYEDLPGVLGEMDVCTVPYRRGELTESCNPLKVFEYLATGLPVVSRPLAGLGPVREEVTTAESTSDWIDALEAALQRPRLGREERIAAAHRHQWEHRVNELEVRLEQAHEIASRRPRGRIPRPAALDARPEEPYETGRIPWKLVIVFVLTQVVGRFFYAGRWLGRQLPFERTGSPLRILVVRRAWIGDMVVFLPALRALRERFRDARITLAIRPGAVSHRLVPDAYVDEIRELEQLSTRSRVERLRSILRLVFEGWDVVVSGALFFQLREAFFAGAPKRVGLFDDSPLQTLSSHLIPFDPTRHEAENNLSLVESLGCSPTGEERVPRIEEECPALRAADFDRERLGLPERGPLVTFHPGAKKASRRWPAERFAELARRLLEADPALTVVLTGSGGERELTESVRNAVPAATRERVVDGAGRTSLGALVRLLQESDVVVSNDSGPMHLARALGRPLVALLGPENDQRWGPHPAGWAPAIALRVVVPCAPCLRKGCAEHYCLRNLGVESAERAVRQLLEGPDSAAREDEADDVWTAATTGLYPVVRRSRALGWKALSDRGMSPPDCCVVLLDEMLADVLLPTRERAPRSGASSGDDPTIESQSGEDLRASYPGLELVEVVASASTPYAEGLGAGSDAGSGSADVPGPPDQWEGWRQVLDATTSSILLPVRRLPRAEEVAALAAALQRWPRASAALPSGSNGTATGALAVRRAAVEEQLGRRRSSQKGGLAESGVLELVLSEHPVVRVDSTRASRPGVPSDWNGDVDGLSVSRRSV